MKVLYNVIFECLVVDVIFLGLGKIVKVGELSYEGLELINVKEVVVCVVKLICVVCGVVVIVGK